MNLASTWRFEAHFVLWPVTSFNWSSSAGLLMDLHCSSSGLDSCCVVIGLRTPTRAWACIQALQLSAPLSEV